MNNPSDTLSIYNQVMDELLERISTLILKCGVKSLTMDDIARSLAMSKKTLYQHFENKKDVIKKVGDYEQQKEFDILTQICEEYPQTIDQLWLITKYLVNQRVKLSANLIYSFNKYYPDITQYLSSRRQLFISNILIKNLNKGIAEELYRNDVDVETMIFFYSLLTSLSEMDMFDSLMKKNAGLHFNDVFNFHLRAIATPSGIYYLETKFKSEDIKLDF
mgnify:FL=1